MLQRFAVLGDVHAEDERVLAALRHASQEGATQVLSVGDLCDGEGDLERTVQLLIKHGVTGVAGNHDRWLLEDELRQLPMAHTRDALAAETIAYLEALPPTLELEAPGGRLLLCHGVDGDDMQRLTAEDDGYALETNDALQRLLAARRHRWMIGGHTHRRMVRSFGGLTVINAGTLAREHDPCFVVVDLSARFAQWWDLSNPTRVAALDRVPLP